jgi:hypothetical protein
MPPKYKTATKVAVSTQTKVLVAVVAVAALGLAAVGYGFGFGSIRPSSLTTTRQVAKPTAKPVEKPSVGKTIGGVQQINPSDWPTFTKLPLDSTVLVNKDLDLYKFMIASKYGQAVSWKQLVFTFEKTSGFSLSDLRLRRGTDEMLTNDYEITCPSCGGDVKGEVKKGTVTSGDGLLVVTLKKEEWVYGSGKDYTLHGILSGVVSGSNLTISLYRNQNQTIGNGYLTNNWIAPFTTSYPTIVNIDMTNPPKSPSDQADLPGIFVWAPSSTSPHSPAIGLNGGSPDWFSDVQIDPSMPLSQALSL